MRNFIAEKQILIRKKKRLQAKKKQLEEEVASQRKALARQFESLQTENERYQKALMEIIAESGKVDINNWPAQQQICQSIAQKAIRLLNSIICWEFAEPARC